MSGRVIAEESKEGKGTYGGAFLLEDNSFTMWVFCLRMARGRFIEYARRIY